MNMNKKYIVPSTELQIIASSMLMQAASAGSNNGQAPISDDPSDTVEYPD